MKNVSGELYLPGKVLGLRVMDFPCSNRLIVFFEHNLCVI